MKIVQSFGVRVVWITAAACSTTQYYWQHDVLAGPVAQQQLTVDQGVCAGASRATGALSQAVTSNAEHRVRPEDPRQFGLTNDFSECMAQRGWSLRAVRP